MHPVPFIEHMLYDEIEMVLRVHADLDGFKEKERTKVYVMQTSWAILLQTQLQTNPNVPELWESHAQEPPEKQHLLLRLACAPQLRITDRSTAEAVRQVLLSSLLPEAGRLTGFPRVLNMAETQEGNACLLVHGNCKAGCRLGKSYVELTRFSPAKIDA